MNSRRKFVQKLTVGLAGSVLPAEAFSALTRPAFTSDDFWENVRNSFPLTKDRVYFNNGTSGPNSQRVVDKVIAKTNEFSISGEYGSTNTSREKLAAFVKVKTEEISLTHNTTEGINIVAWGLPLQKGDEVILTMHEHVGNALPWLNRAKLDGIVLKTFLPAQTAAENIGIIQKLISPKTRVIAIPHITCTTGLVFPVKEIAAIAKSKGIFTAIDGAHGAGTFDLNLKDLGCDFYATSCHKWMLGPSGTGFLYVNEKHLDTLQAYWVGAYSDNGWDINTPSPSFQGYVATAHRYDYGSQSAALFAGAEESVKFLEEIGMAKIEERIRALATHLQKGLTALGSKIQMLTPLEAKSRISMITFKIEGTDFKEFNTIAAKNKFRIRVVPESNLNAIRISTHIYNSFEEIDRFVALVKTLV